MAVVDGGVGGTAGAGGMAGAGGSAPGGGGFGGAGGSGVGGSATAGSGAVGGDAGAGGAGATGTGAPTPPPLADAYGEGGCNCRLEAARPAQARWPLAGLLWLGLVLVRRRRAAG